MQMQYLRQQITQLKEEGDKRFNARIFILVLPNLGLRLVLSQTDKIFTNTTNNMLDFYNFQPFVGLHNISLTKQSHMVLAWR